jgi:outer membrane protein TolC
MAHFSIRNSKRQGRFSEAGASSEGLALQKRTDSMGRVGGKGWDDFFRWPVATCLALILGGAPMAFAQSHEPAIACVRPEQRDIEFRPSMALPGAEVPVVDQIPTVDDPLTGRPTYYLSLDEALQIAILNCRVVRVLNGLSAASTGTTIYDTAIANTQIDQARGRFDPTLNIQNQGGRIDSPVGIPDGTAPSGVRFQGTASESFSHSSSLSKTTTGGGTGTLSLRANPSKVGVPGQLLNPQTSSSLDLALSQPLLRGRGRCPNLAPIVIARIDTERSFYQLQDSVQSLVRSIIEGYWGIVFARTDLWARQQQIKQLQFAYDRFDAQRKSGRGDLGDTAQAQVSLANFKASLIAAEAELINREEALSNALGLPPGSRLHVIPSTPPQRDHQPPEIATLVQTAEQHRPDVAQLKLQLEADEQRILLARNNSLPQVDASALYRWNGLQGTTPNTTRITTQGGEFADWQLGANLAVALGVRADRAALRRAELSMARDRALLEQQVHAATHEIAGSLRNLEQFYAQYKAFQRVREAAQVNLQRQFDVARMGGIRTEPLTYLNVLQAVTDWGNSVSGEAGSLTAYNAELARLDQTAGIILPRHGIEFCEQDYASLGPRYVAPPAGYPAKTKPTPPHPLYEKGDKAAEESFDLKFNALKMSPAGNRGDPGSETKYPEDEAFSKEAEELRRRLRGPRTPEASDEPKADPSPSDRPIEPNLPASPSESPSEGAKAPEFPPLGNDLPLSPAMPKSSPLP